MFEIFIVARHSQWFFVFVDIGILQVLDPVRWNVHKILLNWNVMVLINAKKQFCS